MRKALYFSPAEFAVMLELAGEAPCSLLRGRETPGNEALTQAFAALFQRGLLLRSGNRFSVSGPGQMFACMRSAPWAVFISGKRPYESAAVCYAGDGILWLVELADVILSHQYRVQPLERAEVREWLFSAGFLERPLLTEEDTAELTGLFAGELAESGVRPLLRLEKHVNGGPLLTVYEVGKGRSGQLVYTRSGAEHETAIFTEEALARMLADCFGKGEYDCC